MADVADFETGFNASFDISKRQGWLQILRKMLMARNEVMLPSMTFFTSCELKKFRYKLDGQRQT
jgi:hypothetical protein